MGYVGPSVVKHLRAMYPKATLVGIDIGYFAHCLTNAEIVPEYCVDVQYFADIRKLPEDLLNDVDVVVHLAGISNDPLGSLNEEVTLDINYKASIELAKKAKASGAKGFVFASSCSVYGFGDEGARSEKSTVNPLTAHAKSKVFTESDLEKIADRNFKVTCLRFATACGMSERLRLDLVLNDFVASATATGKIAILSDGTAWRPLINIKDMALAIDWAISRTLQLQASTKEDFLLVNVGSEEWNYRIKELALAVSKIISGVEISINKDAQPDKRSYKVNFDLFKKLAPAHQPKYDLIKTVKELKEGLDAIGFKDKDFRNSSFIRLKVLHDLKNKGLLSSDFNWVLPRNMEKTKV